VSIANYITFIRIIISPIFLLIYTFHTSYGITPTMLPYVLLLLLGISELSDAFDGYIARKYNQVSDFGKIFDPVADSIARITVLLTFTQPPVNLPLVLIVVFLYRDSVTSTLRTICALKGFALSARFSGKMKAVIQAVVSFCILFLMIPESLGMISQTTLQYYSSWIVSLAAIYAVFSGIDYVYANRSYVNNLLYFDDKRGIEKGR
jgi:CDP-diacylglycerol---glycerol-3-phosphate 3-phosphatidyltransferase